MREIKIKWLIILTYSQQYDLLKFYPNNSKYSNITKISSTHQKSSICQHRSFANLRTLINLAILQFTYRNFKLSCRLEQLHSDALHDYYPAVSRASEALTAQNHRKANELINNNSLLYHLIPTIKIYYLDELSDSSISQFLISKDASYRNASWTSNCQGHLQKAENSQILNHLNIDDHAVKTQAPPMALILLSAILLKNLALTTTGWAGRNPLPRTLKNPALVTSMTGTLSLLPAQRVLDCSVRRVQILSRLMVGKWSLLR